ncbi:BnaA09g13530D [Brassica napus]|uniref:BnaA09g13530D protein n=1 Tax=Brassica napus TaxID=3708 RepID=A0A078FI92_BRANA|nr:BnaA09g13530D [Brassica napus]
MSSLILHGRRFFELQKWRHFRFANESPFSSASSTLQDGRKGHNFTVSSYLVDSLGFTTKLAESISRKVSFNDKVNPDSVLSLLRVHRFTDSQISTIITDYPQVLVADAERSLAPKLQFLKSRGASTSELTEVLSKVPKILGSKKDKTLSRYYDFVKEIVQADKSSKFKKLSPSSSLLSQGSKQENKIRNIIVLRELGMPQKLLFSLLTSHVQFVCGKDKFEEVEVYERLGFSVEDVWAIFKEWPIFLGYAEKNIADSIETFLELGFSRDEFVMTMGWPIKAVVSNPSVLGNSMEKRMVPRCNVIKALMSKGLLGSELPSIHSVLVCIDQVFLNKYVMKHDDEQLVAELMGIFSIGPVST